MKFAAASTLTMLILWAVTEHPLVQLGVIACALWVAWLGFTPERDELAPLPGPIEEQQP